MKPGTTVEVSAWWIAGSVATGAIASVVAWWISFRKEKRRATREREEGGSETREAGSAALKGFGELVESLWMAIDLSPPADREKLFGSVLNRFARWVGDLPASESYHHSERAGLLKHSLEAALGAVRRVREIHLRYHDVKGEEDPVAAYRASEVWRYAAFLFGLFHDVGKCMSVAVKAGGEEWNPFAEGLDDFTRRTGARGRGDVRFVPGRGLAEHEALTEWLMGRIVPDEAIAFARRYGVLEDILKASHGFAVGGARGENARQFLERVKGADAASVDRYVKKRRLVAASQEEPAARDVSKEAAAVAAPAPAKGVARPPGGPLRRVHECFFAVMERALERREIQLNAPAADGYVGAKFLCAVYPEYFDKLLALMKREYGGDPDVRGMGGSKDLVTGLSLNTDVIYADPNRGLWKFRFAADMGKDAPRVREGDAVLLFLEKLPEACRRAVEKVGAAPGGWAFRFLVDSKPLDIGDLKGDGANPYDGPAIVGALKEALLSGQLSASLPMRQVFVTHKVTYFVMPACLDVIFGREEVARGWNMNRMLDAMMRTGAVVPGPDGRAMVTVRVGSMRGTVDVVGIDTTKILNWDELGKLEADGKTCPDPIRIVEKVPA